MTSINTSNINELHKAYNQISAILKQEYSLTYYTYQALKLLLDDRANSLPVGVLSRHLNWKKPETTKLMNDLENRGLVVRSISPTDRRVTLISITREGKAVYQRVRSYIRRHGLDEMDRKASLYVHLSKTVSESCGTTLTRIRILRYLLDHEGESVRVNDLSAGLNIASNTVSAATRKLVKQGYIESTKHQDDMRAVNLSLTEKGRKQIDEECSKVKVTNFGKSLGEVLKSTI